MASTYTLKYSDKAKIASKKRREIAVAIVQEYKALHPCIICKEDNAPCLDFHHKNVDDKDFAISAAYMRNTTLLLEEMEKCVVLCSNCHRKVHANLICLI